MKIETNDAKLKRSMQVFWELQRFVENIQNTRKCGLTINKDGKITEINFSCEPFVNGAFGIYIDDDGSLNSYMSGY